MNAIPSVKSLPLDQMTHTEVSAYFYLLARCYNEKTAVYSHVTVEALKRAFALDVDQLEALLDELFNLHLIEENEGVIEVGYLSEKTVVLFSKEDSTDTLNPYEGLLEEAAKFVRSAKRATARSLSQEIELDLEKLVKVKPAEITVPQALTLFKRVAELTLQDEYRAFDAAEAGSIKRLLKNLGGVKLVRMIIKYCQDFSSWGSYPYILNMVKNKDLIYGSFKIEEKLKTRDDESF